jgi:hypothetical protein
MSWEQGTATSAADLLDRLNAFLVKGHTLPPVYSGVGTGSLTGAIGTAASIQETITVTFSSATAFTVAGSITGAMGAGTVGNLFTHAKISFTVTSGGTAWASGDTITCVMTPAWAQMRGVAGSEYIWRAPGNANVDQIYVGVSRFFDTGSGNYDDWRMGGFTGFTAGNGFRNQPGANTVPVMCLWNGSIPYWFIADGRRVLIVAQISTVIESGYLGFIDAYASPGQYAYPLAVGGTMGWTPELAATSPNWRYGYAGDEHSAFWQHLKGESFGHAQAHALQLRRPDGVWRGFSASEYFVPGVNDNAYGSVWPYTSSRRFQNVRPGLDGTYPTFPILLNERTDSSTANIFGELSGVCATTGHGNASLNTLAIGRESWLVVGNVNYTAKNNYCAMRLA